MLSRSMLPAVVAVLLIAVLAGCAPAYRGIYIDEIYTVPAIVMAGETVELHIVVVNDLPPWHSDDYFSPYSAWEVGAGGLYPLGSDELALAETEGAAKLGAEDGVLWRAPDTPQLVLVTAHWIGATLSASIQVH